MVRSDYIKACIADQCEAVAPRTGGGGSSGRHPRRDHGHGSEAHEAVGKGKVVRRGFRASVRWSSPSGCRALTGGFDRRMTATPSPPISIVLVGPGIGMESLRCRACDAAVVGHLNGAENYINFGPRQPLLRRE